MPRSEVFRLFSESSVCGNCHYIVPTSSGVEIGVSYGAGGCDIRDVLKKWGRYSFQHSR